MFHFPVINKSSPQANGLRYCWPMFTQASIGRELGQGANATLTTTATTLGPQSPILTPIYNGTSHYGTAAIDLGDVTTLTASFWLYWDAFGSGDDLCLEYTVIADILASGGGNGFYVDPNAASSTFRVGVGADNGARVRSFVRPTGAVWHHYVILMDRTIDWGIPAIYVDGLSVTLTNVNNTTTPGNFKASSPIYFMSRASTSLYGAGRICDVRLYAGKLLTQAEAWALYDPRTRWDLYMPAEDRRAWLNAVVASGPPAGSLALLGVGR
jgi:hypothetical protein